MKLQNGGKTSNLSNKATVEEIKVYSENPLRVSLWINGESLSYLSVEEAVALRNEINEAIKTATGTL